MSGGMVERVARAIEPGCWDAHVDRWEEPARSFAYARQQVSLEKVRAAIEAMREPTEAMVNAAVADFKAGKSPRNIVYAAIDAALKD